MGIKERMAVAAEDRNGVLLTGATGFLGGEVLARLLEGDERPVYALVRAETDEEADERLRRVIESLLGHAEPYSERAVAIPGDVTMPWLGLGSRRRDALAERVGAIIHCAASVSFTLGIQESRAINVDGTRRMVELAELCVRRGGLGSFVHVSTAYVAGDCDGAFGESDLDVGQKFRNAYEQSKFEAECLIRGRRSRLPIRIVRPSIVVGDSKTGFTPAFNVLYGPLRAFSMGAYPAIPGRRGSPVDVVPVDYVADAIVAVADKPGRALHLTAGDRASSVGELLELGSRYAGKPEPRLLPPTIYRRVLHPLLVRQPDERRRKALRRSEAYFPYFDMNVRYENARARRILGFEAPQLSGYFERLMDFAVAADWGKQQPSRHENLVRRRSGRSSRRRRRTRLGQANPQPG